MSYISFKGEFEQRWNSLSNSSLRLDEDCLDKRDRFIRVVRAAVKKNLMTQHQFKRLINHIDDSLIYNQFNEGTQALLNKPRFELRSLAK